MIVRVGAGSTSRFQSSRPELRGRYGERHEASGECETLHNTGRGEMRADKRRLAAKATPKSLRLQRPPPRPPERSGFPLG
jgi:hypothetical protein